MKTQNISEWKDLGQRIAETRKARGLSQAELGKPLGLDRSAISRIESGTRGVDTLELARIAEVLGRPLDWFILAQPLAVVSRRDAAVGVSVLDGDRLLDSLVRDIQLLVEMKLLNTAHRPSKRAKFRNLGDAERLATLARKELGSFSPLMDLNSAIQSLGLLAFSLTMEDPLQAGAYLSLDLFGVALVNGKMPSGRRRFTLAHELGHHLLQDEYDYFNEISDTRAEREKLIDAFAAHFLMPRRSVEARWKELKEQGEDNKGSATCLGYEYGISWSALTAHLKNLGLVDEMERGDLAISPPTRGELLERGLRFIEDLTPPALPQMYSQGVMRAYRKHKISAERAVEMMYGAIDFEDLPQAYSIPLKAFERDREPAE